MNTELHACIREALSTGVSRAKIKDALPITGLPYEYIVTTSSTYDLCATFDTDSAKDPNNMTSPRMPTETFWFHPVGRHCFHLDIQKDKFAPVVPVSVD